ncbi:DUF2442 domain-containing protein [Adlercreutzia sp. R25]|uniref:DUF2442 domain-containing protein n=1 Tax=Adlercreutzia shanghongiae TaxID=3111773 RepID=A0ABU6J132_9ACTN|nr:MULTISPECIES: DUF2442 domain-containing protein [unclassified Adlercreutzia]MEC4273763.1 DUF2442 domain-containing protein [Adlercreutzia sp. R25]MEC4295841.1 DUF2442 domain-containing protein [Adlercreutzia sp. R22]
MIPRIKRLETLPNLRLKVEFDDGRIVLYDVEEDVREIPSYAPLANLRGLFSSVQLDQSRTCVFWNDEIDLPSDTIYEYGRELVPASLATTM